MGSTQGAGFSLANRTRRNVGGLPFLDLKNAVLGKEFDLSLALVGSKESTAISLKTKNKNAPSNVLAFPLSKTSGEIIICPAAAAPYTLEYLFIHGLLHIKGYEHGATMDSEEHRILKRFGLRSNE